MKFELFFFDEGAYFNCETFEELKVAVLEAEQRRRYVLFVTDLENYTANPDSVYNIVDWQKIYVKLESMYGVLFNDNLEYGNKLELFFSLLKEV